MRSADDLIRKARYRTGQSKYTYNSTTGETVGTATSLFLEALNDAQDNLASRIIKLWPSLFISRKVLSVVSGTQSYSIGNRVSFGAKVISVKYSQTGQEQDYRPLSKLNQRELLGQEGTPFGYVREGDTIYLVPKPTDTSALLKVEFYQRPDSLDISRGTVNGTPFSTEISVASGDTYELTNATYVCISDRFGNVLLRNGIVDSYNSGTSKLTLEESVSDYLEDEYTLSDLDGCFITVGENTTRFSTLPNECERYLRVYMQKRIMTIKENSASIEEDQELINIRNDILSAFGEEDRDQTTWVISDWESFF